MSKALITGAGGFIGSHMVKSFLKAGYAVRASDLPRADLSWAEELGAELAPASIDDSAAIEKAMQGVDLVIHTAGIFDFGISREVMEKVNVEGTRVCCEAARKEGVKRFVHLSSVAVYGIPADSPCREDTLKRPLGPYQESKYASEQILLDYHRRYGLPAVAMRPALVYGPGSRYGYAMYLVCLTLVRYWGQDWFPLLSTGPLSNHVHIEDLIAAAHLLATKEGVEGRVFNVADDSNATLPGVSKMLLELCGIRGKRLPTWTGPITPPLFRVAEPYLGKKLATLNTAMERDWPELVERFGLVSELRPRFDFEWLSYMYDDHLYDNSALKAEGWTLNWPTILDGMPATMEWYREQRWLPALDELVAYADGQAREKERLRKARPGLVRRTLQRVGSRGRNGRD